MSETIAAVVENGMLRPETPLKLAEGTVVRIVILPAQRKPPAIESVRNIVARIAAMPLEPGGPEFSGRDHDRILYGDDGAR